MRITVYYSASHISAGHAYTRVLAVALLVARCYQPIDVNLKTSKAYRTFHYIWTQAYVNLRKHKSREPPRVYQRKPNILEPRVIGLYVLRYSMGLSSLKFRGGLRKTHTF